MPRGSIVSRKRKKRRKLTLKVGTPPGTLVYTGEHREHFSLRVIAYDSDGVQEYAGEDLNRALAFLDSPGNVWLDVVGLHRVDVVETLGKLLGLHPLIVEDILNVQQRPKVESFPDHLVVMARMFSLEDSGEIRTEQVSFVLKDRLLVTFQERPWDVFDPVRERIRTGRGRVRTEGVDYLLYALLDLLVDHGYPILDRLGEAMEALEDRILLDPRTEVVGKIHTLKRNLLTLRRSLWPLREVVSTLTRGEHPLLRASTLPFFQDVADHVVHLMDLVETWREMAGSLLDIYLSSVSNRMNEVMKVLTVFSTLFMPLTFITGIYGMNFVHMPELHWRYGYPAVLLLMGVIAGGMVVYFRKKGWL